jgi:hypothetical protein
MQRYSPKCPSSILKSKYKAEFLVFICPQSASVNPAITNGEQRASDKVSIIGPVDSRKSKKNQKPSEKSPVKQDDDS